MVSIEATERPDGRDDTRFDAMPTSIAGRRLVPVVVLTAIFLTAFVARLLASDVVITADEDNWMRRAGGFTYGLLNGQFGRTYQNGHPGVTTMWVAMLTLGPERMVQYADRVHGQRLVGRVPGFWDALVDARPGFALVTAALVTLIAGLVWRLFGPLVGALSGLLVGLEPFYLAISQLVHMDAILSGCMVASVLAALVTWTRGGGRGWLVVSGVLGGLAILSKVPAVYLLAFVPMLGACLTLLGWERDRSGQDGRAPRGFRQVIVDLAIWGLAAVCAFVLFWPAIWALGPFEVLGRVVDFTRETGGQPHEQGTYFWGSQTADPGPLFYPVAMAFRLAPITIIGLALLAVCWRRVAPDHRRPALALIAYGLGFLLMMTLGAKKLDRYALPIFPALGVLAALGVSAAYGWLRDQMAAATPSTMVPWKSTAVALVVVLAVWPAATTYPYYLSYYNPLLGGGPAAQRTVMVGNGEGLDQVAEWLNAQPGAPDHWIVSQSFDILQALIVASGEPLRDRVPSNADFVVLYRFQIQIGHSPRVLDEYLNRRMPEHVVTINGVEYARIYRGPHQMAGAEFPAGELAAMPPVDHADALTDDEARPARSSSVLDAARGGWHEEVKPRLRRLRTVATRLVTSSSEGQR
ncbi:MAG TPA: glycosyltransferase family 39 protein [Chloroflexota bacterium]|nr:glycosyltransferase family 39 protein [Chloroflexota bacterium]